MDEKLDDLFLFFSYIESEYGVDFDYLKCDLVCQANENLEFSHKDILKTCLLYDFIFDIVDDNNESCFIDLLFDFFLENGEYDSICDKLVYKDLSMEGIFPDTVHYTVKDISLLKIIDEEIIE